MSSGTTDRLVRAAREEPLSNVFPAVLSVAKQVGLQPLSDWVSLEMRGYYHDNPAATENTKRPKYREVRGRYVDQQKREINIQGQELRQKLNAVRLPHAVSTLERLADSDAGHLLDNPRGDLVQEYYGVRPAGFYISAASVQDALSSIQHELIERLEQHRKALDEITLPRGEVPGDEEGLRGFLLDHVMEIVVGLIVTVGGGLILYWLVGGG